MLVSKYLGLIFMVQPRQQPHHDAQDPRVHDHGVTFIHPVERGEAGYQTWAFQSLLLLQNFLVLSKTGHDTSSVYSLLFK